MFGISGFELLIVATFALIIFGPDKIPNMARTAGRFIGEFKRAQENMEAMVRAEVYGEKPKKTPEAPKPSTPVVPEYADDDEEEEEE